MKLYKRISDGHHVPFNELPEDEQVAYMALEHSPSQSPALVASFNRIDALAESATRHGYSKAIADMAREVGKAFNEPRRRSLSLEEIFAILTRLGKD